MFAIPQNLVEEGPIHYKCFFYVKLHEMSRSEQNIYLCQPQIPTGWVEANSLIFLLDIVC